MKILRTGSGSSERIDIVKGENVLLTVAPWYGGKITQGKLLTGDVLHDIYWPISDDDLKTNAWFKQTILFPYPNRLEDGQYTFEGKSYQWPINQPEANNQLHGMVFNLPFVVEKAESNGAKAVIDLVFDYNGDQAYYPFPFSLKVSYQYEMNQMDVVFEVINKGEGNMPFGLGWHPYFQIDKLGVSNYVIETKKLISLPLSNRSLPTGERIELESPILDLAENVLDNAYELPEAPQEYALRVKNGLKLNFKVSDSMNYLQLFTPPGGETVAIEPMTANVNAFNNGNGLRILSAGEKFGCSVNLKLSKS